MPGGETTHGRLSLLANFFLTSTQMTRKRLWRHFSGQQIGDGLYVRESLAGGDLQREQPPHQKAEEPGNDQVPDETTHDLAETRYPTPQAEVSAQAEQTIVWVSTVDFDGDLWSQWSQHEEEMNQRHKGRWRGYCLRRGWTEASHRKMG